VRNVSSFFGEVKGELSKVVWPKKEEVIKLTLLILIISVIVGAYVGGLDYAFTLLLEYIVSN
jgi:preprotein translocase subunit SecE